MVVLDRALLSVGTNGYHLGNIASHCLHGSISQGDLPFRPLNSLAQKSSPDSSEEPGVNIQRQNSAFSSSRKSESTATNEQQEVPESLRQLHRSRALALGFPQIFSVLKGGEGSCKDVQTATGTCVKVTFSRFQIEKEINKISP
ncbi:hypothetical protein CB1_056579094 [Camelus ferus]|nr:hypothetical protein CB1_056579094 [Camelus ferus]